MIAVTGGAGFIGSCIIRSLNDRGCSDIIIVDDAAFSESPNIKNKKYFKLCDKNVFLSQLFNCSDIDAIIHMGAGSSTAENNFEYLYSNNFLYTKALWEYCAEKQVPFIYASSAATYGDGGCGFGDGADIDRLFPLNAYGWSKQIFDLWVKHRAESFPPQHAGLKFFNVYGPNEYFKGSMASMVFHGFNQIRSSGKIKLFKSYDPNYTDGGQLRDFVYVKDVCSLILWLLENRNVSGLFNVGTGRAESFNDLAAALFDACGIKKHIEYTDMPDALKDKYQYYTQASTDKIRKAGYKGGFRNLSDGISDYVQNYLQRDYLIY